MEESIIDVNKVEETTAIAFKKPVLIGKVGRLPRKTTVVAQCSSTTRNLEETEKPPDIINKDETVIQEDKSDDKDSITEVVTQEITKRDEKDVNVKESSVSLNYVQPIWSGLPVTDVDYSFEVLKSGVIIEKLNLMKKPFWTFGRLPACDFYMAHPTISRYHAVLQYKVDNSSDRPPGFYIYDLGSTHGTFLNKNRIKPKMYVRIQVGHMLKLGCSTRSYLLVGPNEDTENESELTITELKEKRAQELKEREEQQLREAKELEELKRKEEERGIDWGMGEDADEETDLTENPYAETNNEQLYLDDPKKTLRGFMEREGAELHYEVTERGMGQFLCSVVLPIDDARGRPIVAEALVKGKKKEAVVQCALEACRILDRHGVLRQATHESKKRKAKNWEENDYYDSDDDTFLDRTGTIERKREMRMKSKQQQQPETYQTLVVKEENLSKQIHDIEKQLSDINRANSRDKNSGDDVDSLDQFMSELSSNKPDKFTVGKLKTDLTKLKKEHAEIVRLVNIARPAHLPPLVPQTSVQDGPSTSGTNKSKAKALPMFGKRLKVKVTVPERSEPEPSGIDDNEEEEDSDSEIKIEDSTTTTEEVEEPSSTTEETGDTRKGIIKQLEIKMSLCDERALASLDNKVKAKISKTVTKLRKIAEEEERIVVDEKRLAVQKKKIFEQINSADPRDIDKQIKLSNVLNKMTGEICTIGDRKLKIVDKINKLADDINNIAVEIRAASQVQHEKAVNRMKDFVEIAHKQQTEIFGELEKLENSVTDPEVLNKLKELYDWLSCQKIKMLENLEKLKSVKLTDDSQLLEDIIEFEMNSDKFITTILEELRKMRLSSEEASPSKKLKTDNEDTSQHEDNSEETESERKRKKNMRRIMQRQEKLEAEKKKQYEEDAQKEDYNMWVPPEGQTGDGRTALNEKFGY